MDDSKDNIMERNTLIIRLFKYLYKNADDVFLAPPREALCKYGGDMSIEEFKKSSQICHKEFRLIMPPMKSVVPLLEQGYVESNRIMKLRSGRASNDGIIWKRTKPLPGSQNNILQQMGIVTKS